MSIVEDVTRHWYIVFSIPLVAALIGYVTKLVAIRMMFEPIEFVGSQAVPSAGRASCRGAPRGWPASPSTR